MDNAAASVVRLDREKREEEARHLESGIFISELHPFSIEFIVVQQIQIEGFLLVNVFEVILQGQTQVIFATLLVRLQQFARQGQNGYLMSLVRVFRFERLIVLRHGASPVFSP